MALSGIVVTPTISNPSPASLSGSSFIYAIGNGPSSVQSFSFLASNLTDVVGVKAPADFEIASTLNGTYGDSLTFNPSSGIIASTTIYVRLKAGLSLGNYSNENIILHDVFFRGCSLCALSGS